MNWDLTPEQRDLQAEARILAREVIAPRAAEVDRSEQYPFEKILRTVVASRALDMKLPQARGGYLPKDSER